LCELKDFSTIFHTVRRGTPYKYLTLLWGIITGHKIKGEEKYMKLAKDKTAAIAIAIFLTLSMAASMMLVPTASAHTPTWKITTYAYISVAPNPVGVNQKVNVIMWLDKTIWGAAEFSGPWGSSNDIRFHNYNLTITCPNGTVQTTIFPVCNDLTSAQYYAFTPNAVGNYTFTFTFPGQLYTFTTPVQESGAGSPVGPNQYTNDTYLPSSATTTLTVQKTPITALSSAPLPTEYWTRPIYGENTNWWTISSNWLGTGSPQLNTNYVSDAVGSQTGHIMWTKPLQSGGVAGGNEFVIQGDTYYEGSIMYRFANPIIMDGMLYYTEPVSYNGGSSGPTVCVNLQTGQQIWSSTTIPALSFGYIYDFQGINQHGVYPPIIVATVGTTWEAFDADTGDPLFNATNVPAGNSVMGPQGEILTYVIANAGTTAKPYWYLSEWNSSRLWMNFASFEFISGTVDASASSCYDWNISIPWYSTMDSMTVVAAYYNNLMLCYNGSLPNGGAAGNMGEPPSSTPYTFFAVNLNASVGAIGKILWMQTYNPPLGNITVEIGAVDPATNVFILEYRETVQWVGYSLATGKYVWGPTASQTAINPYDFYGNQFSGLMVGQVAYGNLYSSGFAGIMYCYNDMTGNLEWTYGNGGTGNSTSAGYNIPYGVYPTMILAIGDGVIYTVCTEHTMVSPIYKGELARAINATDGKQIWTLSDYCSSWDYAMADGYNTFFNGYDNQIYCVGRGPSATTVSTPHAALSFGQPIVISGTVTDISAGTTQTEQAADFPHGVPCASDASMSAWMSYVYQQQPEPTNFTGVPVTISVTDSNGNHYNIGTVTTDESGTYSLTWTPIIPGNFTVYATFAGTKGYYSSSAEDHFTVMQAPSATATPTATPTSVVNTYFVPAITGLFVLIIIVAIVLALLMLRKRP
jgi:hypothetical protein